MSELPMNPGSGDIVPYQPGEKTLRLKKDTPHVDFPKTLGDIIRCLDTANVIQNVKRGIEYVVQVPAEYQAGLEAGKYTVLAGKDGRQWATLYEVLPNGKHSFACNMPIKPEALVQGNPMHDVSMNMQMMAMQQQLAKLTELVQDTYEAVKRIEQGQTDDRVGKLRAGKEGMEQAILIEDPVQRKIAVGNAQQLLLEARGQIGETLKSKVQAFPAIPKSQVAQFFARLSSGSYFSGKDAAFDAIQEYFQLYLWATKLLADSYYYIGETRAAEKAYKDAIAFVRSLDFTNVKTLQYIHPKEDLSDTVCELAVPYVLTEQAKSVELAKPYDTVELLLTGDEIKEAFENGEE